MADKKEYVYTAALFPTPDPARGKRRTKLGNQIQKGIREGKTPLPADPFQGFRDKTPEQPELKALAAAASAASRTARKEAELAEGFRERPNAEELIVIAKSHAAAHPATPARDQAAVDAAHEAQLEAERRAEHDEPNAAMKSATTAELKQAESMFAGRVANAAKARTGTSANWENERHLSKLRTELGRRGAGNFDSQHPRHPSGSSKGGEFAPKK